MPIRGNVFFKSGIYHIFNRGPNLFRTHEQYSRSKDLFYQYSIDYQISIIAYCLMPNHYHFLLQQNGDTPISKLIGSVFNQYVQYVNHLNSRKGPLFESRFKHILVEKEEYLQVLCRYIHLNPVSAGIISNVEDWATVIISIGHSERVYMFTNTFHQERIMLILFIKIKNHCQYGLHLINSGNLPYRKVNLKHSSGG